MGGQPSAFESHVRTDNLGSLLTKPSSSGSERRRQLTPEHTRHLQASAQSQPIRPPTLLPKSDARTPNGPVRQKSTPSQRRGHSNDALCTGYTTKCVVIVPRVPNRVL